MYRASDRLLLAQCTSTAVVVQDGRAVPVPNADLLKALVVDRTTALSIALDGERPADSTSRRCAESPPFRIAAPCAAAPALTVVPAKLAPAR